MTSVSFAARLRFGQHESKWVFGPQTTQKVDCFTQHSEGLCGVARVPKIGRHQSHILIGGMLREGASLAALRVFNFLFIQLWMYGEQKGMALGDNNRPRAFVAMERVAGGSVVLGQPIQVYEVVVQNVE